MERNLKSIIGYCLISVDGIIGEVIELYFDDETWAVRYLVIDTISWLANRKVLVSPVAVIPKNWANKAIPVNLTSKQIWHSPQIDTHKPVSIQQEIALHDYYAWGEYRANWVYNGANYSRDTSPVKKDKINKIKTNFESTSDFDHHLRSTAIVTSYHVHANDGEIGHVNDFIFDDQNWHLKYVVADTHNWIGGKKVLIPVKHIEKIDSSKSEVFVDLSVSEVKDCRLFDFNEFTTVDLAKP